MAPIVHGAKVLLPRAAEARELLPRALTAAGATVVDVATYRASPAARLAPRVEELLAEGGIDAVTFTSSSTVRHFHSLLGGRPVGRAVVAAIGPITADTARELGFRVDVVAKEYTLDGLTAGLVDYFATRR
jgi:uroporphyrinogen III methyltransferase/synthase